MTLTKEKCNELVESVRLKEDVMGSKIERLLAIETILESRAAIRAIYEEQDAAR